MNKQEIENYNRLCAEFLGLKKGWWISQEKPLTEDKKQWFDIDGKTFLGTKVYYDKDLQFHSDWNWIMAVIKAIEKLGYWIEIVSSNLGTNTRNYPIIWCEIGKESHTDLLLDDCYETICRAENLERDNKEAVVQAIDSFFKFYYKNTDILNSNSNTEMFFSILEVEETINDCNVEKLLDEYEKQEGSLEEKSWEEIQIIKAALIIGFKTHRKLVKDKLFTIEDMRKAFELGLTLIEGNDYNEEHFQKLIQSLLPKTEWNIELVDGKIKLI